MWISRPRFCSRVRDAAIGVRGFVDLLSSSTFSSAGEDAVMRWVYFFAEPHASERLIADASRGGPRIRTTEALPFPPFLFSEAYVETVKVQSLSFLTRARSPALACRHAESSRREANGISWSWQACDGSWPS